MNPGLLASLGPEGFPISSSPKLETLDTALGSRANPANFGNEQPFERQAFNTNILGLGRHNPPRCTPTALGGTTPLTNYPPPGDHTTGRKSAPEKGQQFTMETNGELCRHTHRGGTLAAKKAGNLAQQKGDTDPATNAINHGHTADMSTNHKTPLRRRNTIQTR